MAARGANEADLLRAIFNEQGIRAPWHKVGVELKHRAVSRIGINNKFTVRKALRQVVRVLARDHAIAVAVRDEDREMDL
jgi:hypothetical protein